MKVVTRAEWLGGAFPQGLHHQAAVAFKDPAVSMLRGRVGENDYEVFVDRAWVQRRLTLH